MHLGRYPASQNHIFFLLYFTLQYCIGFAIHQHESTTGVPILPILNPHTISLGHPSAPAPSILYLASNLDWQSFSYMILYMFQCHSPKSSHPLPLPQSLKDCLIHLCLFCCLAYRVIITIFLNSIYMCQYMALHSSTLAWKIPWMEEPGRLQSMGSQRVRHN